MTRIYFAALVAGASALTQQIYEPKFLQTTPVDDYANFGSATCQFELNYSWYSFVNTASLTTPVYY